MDTTPHSRNRPTDPPTTAALHVAARQYGLLSWDQGSACGIRSSDIRRLRRNHLWGRPYPRVYSVRRLLDRSDHESQLRSAVMAAQLALGPRSFAGGETAARLWRMQGLKPWDQRGLHMVIPALGSQRHIHGITLHSWDTAADEVTTIGNGLRLTTPGRTLRDTLLRVDRDTAVCLMDSALNQGLVYDSEITHLEAANRGRRGCRRVRTWWPLADGRAQSALETRIRLVCADAGLPPSDLQHRFTDTSGGLIGVVDFWWDGLNLIAEADGLGPHSTARALARDRERQNALQLWHPGVRIVRFTWQDLNRPGYILSTVARAGR